MDRAITILHAPSPLGLAPPARGVVPGVWRMPAALRAAGLHDALQASFAGEVACPAYDPTRDRESRVRNLASIERYSRSLADAVEPLLEGPELPLVLGGDCSIFIGIALGLRRRGRFGVVYIDAHSDCQTPEISGTGGIAGMPLAIATGRGPGPLTSLSGGGPTLAERDAVLVGVRDLFDVAHSPHPHIMGTGIRVHDLEAVRSTGLERTAHDVLRSLTGRGLERVWVHLDADVLDPRIMPAVDSPDPGGMTSAELSSLLRPLLEHPAVVGMNVTIYDPDRDPDGASAGVLIRTLTAALQTR